MERRAERRTTGTSGTIAGARRAAAVLALACSAALAACGAERGAEVDEVGAGTGVDGPAEDTPAGDEDPTLADEGVDIGDDEGTDVRDGAGAVAPDGAVTAELEVTAGVQDDTDAVGQALLSCGPDTAVGALWLEGAAAEVACRALAEPSVRARLDAPDPDEVCTEVYGGPEVATIVGTVGDEQVDAVVRRDDGCGIDRWDALAPLLPPTEEFDAVT